MASCTLVGLAAASGVPLFVRHSGPGKAPAYALIGSLNGVHVFGESHGVTLCSTRTQNASLTWKTYHDSIRLVLIRGSEVDADSCDSRLLDLMFASLVLLQGLDNLTSGTNVERLKRDIRPSYLLLDELLSRAVGSSDKPGFSHLTGCAECILPPEQHMLQNELEKYAEGADSSCACVVMHGQVVSGTRSFWSLSNTELVLLPLLVATNAFTVARDVPIYLPDKSPNVPFRMLVVKLTGHVHVVTLCGPTPSLSEIIRLASSSWAPVYQVLESMTTLLPWNIAPGLLAQIDHSVIGEESRSPSLNTAKKAAALQAVYRSVVGPLLQPPAVPPDDFPSRLHPDHTPLESYVCTDNYKVYVMQSSSYHLLVLYPPALPIQIARKAFCSLAKLFPITWPHDLISRDNYFCYINKWHLNMSSLSVLHHNLGHHHDK
ncbi:Protein fuzzy [Chionoecetes opilio]|uniref:Protein fuzzy n=1 Tax=Chionoecetes opilio TaxID=41210 RepID=A0A8J8WLT2_CHIOP|nr:Protein fuzzy [Chionoecetes opilio]